MPRLTHIHHVAEFLTLVALILPAVVMYVTPAETEMIRACGPDARGKTALADCEERVAAAAWIHLLMLPLKIIMFVFDVIKYNQPGEASAPKKKE